MTSSRGLTLIELLVVIATMAIFTAIVTVTINPAREYARARDTQRKADLYVLVNALDQYTATKVKLPATAACIGSLPPCFDLSFLVPDYLPELPRDPSTGTPANTQYFISQDASGHIIASVSGEITPVITLAR